MSNGNTGNAAAPRLPPRVAPARAAVVAFGVIGGFVWMYGTVMHQTWTTEVGRNPDGSVKRVAVSEQFEDVATGLAGLIGAVLAMVFNERLPAAQDPAGSPVVRPAAADSAFGPSTAVAAPRGAADPTAGAGMSWQQAAAAVYTVAYFLTSAAAVVTWLGRENAPDLIKDLALIFLGLCLAIARSFFNVPK